MFVGKGDRLRDGDIGEAGIGINEEEVFAFGFGGQLLAGPGFTSPAIGQRFPGEETDAGVALGAVLDESGRTVGRVVVENKDFHIGVVVAGYRADT